MNSRGACRSPAARAAVVCCRWRTMHLQRIDDVRTTNLHPSLAAPLDVHNLLSHLSFESHPKVRDTRAAWAHPRNTVTCAPCSACAPSRQDAGVASSVAHCPYRDIRHTGFHVRNDFVRYRFPSAPLLGTTTSSPLQMLFVPTRPSRGLLFCGCSVRLSVRLSRFATRCGRTVAISTPRICRKNSNVKTNRAVRFSADKYAEAEAI